MSRQEIRRRLQRLEQQRAGNASEPPPAMRWDEFVALNAERRPAFRLDWDSLANSQRPSRDRSTIITAAEHRLKELEAALSTPAAMKSGFVSVPTTPPTEGTTDEPHD